MTLIISPSNDRFGNLPQAYNFGALACTPTSVANALLALGVDELMQDPSDPSLWQSLYDTRNKLATDYFFTSRLWSSVVLTDEYGNPIDEYLNQGLTSLNPKLPTPEFFVAAGSAPSLVIKGTIDYINDQKAKYSFDTPITVSASGLISGEIDYKNNKGGTIRTQKMNFAGFDLINANNINGSTITTPSLNDYQEYFNELKPGNSNGVLDFLMAGLLRGPVVFGMYYTTTPGGHAVVATSIEIDDKNANGVIEFGEGKIYFIDPLNPSNQYTPSTDTETTVKPFNLIQSTGSTEPTEGEIWQDPNGFLKLSYSQSSVALVDDKNEPIYLPDTPGKIATPNGDISNRTDVADAATDIIANITLAMSLNTSGLAPDFDRNAGALSSTTPGLIDFSDLLDDKETQSKNLQGYAYSNEESAFKNIFLYYEILDVNGAIWGGIDPLTGQRTTLSPGDEGYNNAAWALAQELSNGNGPINIGYRESTDRETLTTFEVDLSKLETGYLAPIAITSQGFIYTPFANANSDGMQHFQSRGSLSWGLEDLLGLGDRDFNDLHVSILIESII